MSMMFNLGFTMEELMFPENDPLNFLCHYESYCSIDKFDQSLAIDDYHQEQIILDNDDDDDDDWFTIKQLHSNISSNNHNVSPINDQILPLTNVCVDNSHFSQMKSMIDCNGHLTTLLVPNLSIKLTRDQNNTSSSSDILPTNSFSPPYDQQSVRITKTGAQQQSNKHLMSKSTSSLSFGTHSSTSMTSNSADELSLNSNDLNEILILHHSSETRPKLSHYQKTNPFRSATSLNISNRRRRKRTIFTAADIEYLKEAFIQNPKPSRKYLSNSLLSLNSSKNLVIVEQDIAILSEQLGHDSYVIRVWFYNKRQATKKQLN